jgi:hypothetical protein
MTTQQEACREYIKLLKRTEDLKPEELSLARESFNEGWLQRELKFEREGK